MRQIDTIVLHCTYLLLFFVYLCMGNYKVYGLQKAGTREIRYIGLTKNTLQTRLRGHKKEHRSNRHKSRWIRACGMDIEIVLLEASIPSLAEANKKEQQYITLFKALGARLLNATNGGDGTPGFPSWNKGRACEYRDKLIGNSPSAKQVACYNLSGNLVEVYRSVKHAATSLGVGRQSIQLVAHRAVGHKQAKGYTFRWATGEVAQKIAPVEYDEQARIASVRKGTAAIAQRVLIEKEGRKQWFANAGEAAEALGLKKRSVSTYCSANKVNIHGKFSYA
jgi:hypothetical protein